MIRSTSVKTAYANIYNEPRFGSELVTQALFFESLDVISERGNWLEVRQWDGYKGYTHSFYTTDEFRDNQLNHIVNKRSINLYDSPGCKNIVSVAPFASNLAAEQVDESLYVISCNDGKDYYFIAEDPNVYGYRRDDIIKNALSLVGSPYLWGGKTPFGYDCSGFVQSIFRASRINIMRDTSDQIKEDRLFDIDIDTAKPGDIIFFAVEGKSVDHVGFFLDTDKILHCSGSVKVDFMYLDSSKKLTESIIAIKSIDNLVNNDR